MAGKMKAVVKLKAAPGGSLVDFDVPELDDGSLLVRVDAVAVCGSDVHIYDWHTWVVGAIHPPRIWGHEFAGRVVEVGREVSRFQVGDYVTAESLIPCGHCYQCQTGHGNRCENVEVVGVHRDGAFAEYIAVPETIAWKVEDSLPPEVAALLEPFGVAIHAISWGDVIGSCVAVFGAGPIGLFCVGAARAAGASRVFSIDHNDARLKIAGQMGASSTVNPRQADPVRVIRESASGAQVELVVDCTGSAAAIRQGLEILARGGRLALVGTPSSAVELDLARLVIQKEVLIRGVRGREIFGSWYKSMHLLSSGLVDVRPVITHQLPLEQFERGIELVKSREAGKVIFRPRWNSKGGSNQ